MMRTWEQLTKFKFGNSPKVPSYEVNIPGYPDDPAKKCMDGYHNLDRVDVKNIFDPIVNHIINLVQKQVCAIEGKDGKVAVCHIFPVPSTVIAGSKT